MYDSNKALPVARNRRIPDYTRPRRRNYGNRGLHFEKYISEANYFINQVAERLATDRQKAVHITKAVLHAVRDRLPPVDAVQFAQGLPMLLKAIYFEQYDIAKAPVYIRHPKDFINYVRYKYGRFAARDLNSDVEVEDCIAAVFRVLEKTMDFGQVEQIKRMMNDDMAYLFY